MLPRPLVGWGRVEFGQLIFRKIIKNIATYQNRLKCTKIDFGWGSAPDPAEELALPHSDPLDLRAYF